MSRISLQRPLKRGTMPLAAMTTFPVYRLHAVVAPHLGPDHTVDARSAARYWLDEAG